MSAEEVNTGLRIFGRVALLALVHFIVVAAVLLIEKYWRFDAGIGAGWVLAFAFLGLFPSARPWRD